MLMKTARFRSKATFGGVHTRCQSWFLDHEAEGRDIFEIKYDVQGITRHFSMYRHVFVLLDLRSGHERLLKDD